MKIDLDTWVISDTHFLHKNIIGYCGRPFMHDVIMVAHWIKNINDDDTVLHLGDLFMGNATTAKLLLEQLPGDKYMIRGNHDKKSIKWYEEIGFKLVGDFGRIYWKEPIWEHLPITDPPYIAETKGKTILFSHEPQVDAPEPWDINIHGHIHNNGYPIGTPEDKDYRNVSVEVVGYRPVRLSDILYGGKYQSRKEAGTNKEKRI